MRASEMDVLTKPKTTDQRGLGYSKNREIAVLCNALAHPVRVRILCLLIENECIFGDLVVQFPLSQSTVSQHIAKLKEAGLVFGEPKGLRVCYCVNRKRVQQFRSLIEQLLSK